MMASRVLLASASAAGIRFGRAVLMVRGAEGVAESVNFYQNALGMNVSRHTDEWAELTCGVASGGSDDDPVAPVSTPPTMTTTTSPLKKAATPAITNFRLSIKAVESEAQLSHGYTPFLSFDVDDMDSVVARCAQMGAKLDGPIQYPAHGKVAVMRAPDGHMIGLYEPSI
mmetsp:Transcript_26864/g.31722  ORF Transcript_26864/g.31722 Transcript_26864/m.31722 type:complete len:170 (+) Transcript_26864:227-736(+)